MFRARDAQTLGSLLVFGAFAAAEAAARLLEAYPASAIAWYLNFEVFYTFEMARLPDSPLALLFGPHGLLVDAAVIAAVIVARATKSRLMIAFLANLGFAAMIALIHCRLVDPVGSALARAVLRDVRQIELALGAVLLVVSFAAFASSHLTFVAAMIREHGQRRRAPVSLRFGLGAAPLVASTC